MTAPRPGHTAAFAAPSAPSHLVAAPPRPPASSVDLRARMEIVYEQLLTTQGEIVLGRAAYQRIREEELAARPWLRDPLQQLAVPRVARAMAVRLAAIERFRLWALELDWLQRKAAARGIL